MKIVVVGATGNVGSHTVNEALAQGHEVVAYVRRPEAIAAREHLTIAKGDAGDTAALAAAASGADAVIVSIMGTLKDTTFLQRTLPNIVDAIKLAKAKRLVLVSAFGSGETAPKASGLARTFYRLVLGKMFEDKAASEKILPGSGIDYTILYPVLLKKGPALPEVAVEPLEVVGKVPGMPSVPYANVAKTLVRLAGDPQAAGAHLLITTSKGWKRA
ncbi:NAD(P)-dependent oxidoreductase [Diaminobutyricibacter sp. McL0618]|uniref:NAD(P)-dependent oxidoreductase n=1 Tax=Leifsonia sp. McL0618 TaxID=3415677 RepID=UPI003CF1E643